MKLTPNQMNKIAAEVFNALAGVDNVTVNAGKEKFKSTVVQVLKQNMEDEKELDAAVNAMMEQLEQQNPNSFEHYKMFPLLKKKLAEQRGFIL